VKTKVLLVLGAFVVAALVFALHDRTAVPTDLVMADADAAGKTVSTPGRNADVPALEVSRGEVPPGTRPHGPALPAEAVRAPVRADVFEHFFQRPLEGAPTQPERVMHERFSKEVVDPNWAPNVEPQMQARLRSEGFRKLVDVVFMECRAATCEILAASPAVALNSQSTRMFQEQIFAMTKEPWWTGYEFKYPSVMITFAPDGRAIMIAHISTLKSK
jgi:hypothetical protein